MSSDTIRILLVEDNPADARFLKEALVDAGEPFCVTQVERIGDALDHLAGTPVDAVLLDLFLPDSQGIETVQRAIGAAPQAPIVVLTGADDEGVALEAVRCGAQDFLVKGRTDPRSLARAIRYAVERKRTEDALRRARDAMGLEVQERSADLAKAVEALEMEARRRAVTQAVVAEQSRLLEAFFRHALTPLVFLDPEFNFLRVNEAYARACQRDVAEFAGHNHFEFYPHAENEAVFREVVRTKTPYRAVAKPFNFPDHPEWGTTYWDWTLVPVLDAAGDVELLVYSLEDVTERKRAEAAVAAEQRRFQEVLDKLPAYLALLSRDHRVVFASRFFEERFGKPLGKRCYESLFHRTKPCEGCESAKVFETNTLHHWEWTGPDGRIYDIYDFPFTDVDGTPMIMKVGLDVTERKRAEEELRSASAYARNLFEASLDPLVTISPAGLITDVNKATEEVTGVPRECLIGSDFSEYFTDPEKAREGYRTVIAEGFIKDFPLTIRHLSGRATDVSYNATVYRNEAGEVQGVFAAARDVTERLRAEKALWQSEARYRSLALATSLIVWTTTPQGEVVEELPSWRDFTGQTGEAAMGWGWVWALHPEDRERTMDVWTSAVRTQTLYETEYRLRRRDGEYRHMAVRGVPVLDPDGTIREWIGTCSDITERKQAEEQLRALNEALERRAAQLRVMSAEVTRAEHRERRRLAQILHDHLQQLLYAARLSLGAIKGGIKDGNLHAPLQAVDDLLRESLDASRSLTVELSPPILYVANLATALEWLGQHMQEKYGLAVQVEAEAHADVPAIELRILLFHAVRELLFNVVKHADVPRAEVRLTRPDPGNVQVSVRDEGAGFDATRIQFDRAVAGGFGLFSLRERLELVGGSLEVDSSPGKGTRAVIQAPSADAEQVAGAGDKAGRAETLSAELPSEPRPRPGGAGKIRVLLADDHKVLREGLARLLREQPDLELVGEADHGKQAIELALQTQPDVVIMDVAMPVLNGIEATRRIVAALPDVRVIGLSMYEEEDTANAMLAAGAAVYLPKGGASAPLIAAIRQVGAGHAQPRPSRTRARP